MSRVLLINDDEDMSEFVIEVCQSIGVTCQLSHRGIDAVISIRSFNPDLVILDLGIPQDKSIEIFNEISKEFSQLIPKTIVTTGNSNLVPASLKLKIGSVLEKPLRGGLLKKAINCLLPQSKTPLPPTILVAEDSGIFRLFAKKTLMEEGFRVIEAKNGLEAFRAYQLEPTVKMILTDIHMPEMDGLTLVRKIRLLDKNLPIFVVSSESGKDFVAAGKAAGITGWMMKPLSEEQLKASIEVII